MAFSNWGGDLSLIQRSVFYQPVGCVSIYDVFVIPHPSIHLPLAYSPFIWCVIAQQTRFRLLQLLASAQEHQKPCFTCW